MSFGRACPGGVFLAPLFVADYRFLDRDGPIDTFGLDDQVVQPWIFTYISDAMTDTPLFDRGPIGRPLIALWALISNVPVPGGFSFVVAHFMRHWRLWISNESVWASP